MPSEVPTTIMFSRLSRISLYVGLITNWPLTKPTRTAPMGPRNGMSEMVRAAEAPLIPATSGSFSVSAESTSALTGTAFALDEAAGNASAGVGIFAVVNRQREEIDALAGVGVGGCGGQYDVIADSHHDRAVGLLGQLSSFERNAFTAG